MLCFVEILCRRRCSPPSIATHKKPTSDATPPDTRASLGSSRRGRVVPWVGMICGATYREVLAIRRERNGNCMIRLSMTQCQNTGDRHPIDKHRAVSSRNTHSSGTSKRRGGFFRPVACGFNDSKYQLEHQAISRPAHKATMVATLDPC
jgi:hypothetical protein